MITLLLQHHNIITTLQIYGRLCWQDLRQNYPSIQRIFPCVHFARTCGSCRTGRSMEFSFADDGLEMCSSYGHGEKHKIVMICTVGILIFFDNCLLHISCYGFKYHLIPSCCLKVAYTIQLYYAITLRYEVFYIREMICTVGVLLSFGKPFSYIITY